MGNSRFQVVGFVVAAMMFSAAVHADGPTTAPADSRDAANKILDTAVPLLNLDSVGLEDTLKTVQQNSGLTIDVEWDQLAKINVTRQSVVSIRLRNVRWSKVLNAILGSAAGRPADGADPMDVPAVMVKDNGHVLVTTERDLHTRFLTKVTYPIGDFLPSGQPGDKPLTEAQRKDWLESLQSLITDTVDVGRWASKPGDLGGTIEIKDNTLVVNNHEQAQAQIAALLAKLREQRRSPATRPTPAGH